KHTEISRGLSFLPQARPACHCPQRYELPDQAQCCREMGLQTAWPSFPHHRGKKYRSHDCSVARQRSSCSRPRRSTQPSSDETFLLLCARLEEKRQMAWKPPRPLSAARFGSKTEPHLLCQEVDLQRGSRAHPTSPIPGIAE